MARFGDKSLADETDFNRQISEIQVPHRENTREHIRGPRGAIRPTATFILELVRIAIISPQCPFTMGTLQWATPRRNTLYASCPDSIRQSSRANRARKL